MKAFFGLFGLLAMVACQSSSGTESGEPCELAGATEPCDCFGTNEQGTRLCGDNLIFSECAGCPAANAPDAFEGTCYRCLDDDPFAIECAEETLRTDGSRACVSGSSVALCAFLADCCRAHGLRADVRQGTCGIPCDSPIGDIGDCIDDTDDSADIFLEPPLIERDDGQLRAEITFEQLSRTRQTSKPLTIRQSGATDLIVSRVYIEGAEDCDLIKAGLRAGDRLPGNLEQTCQFRIADGPIKSDGTTHYVTADDPLILGPDNFVTYTVKYKATQDTPPAAAILVIESNVLGKERVEVELKVLTGQPQIAVTPNTIGFASGMAGDTLLNVRNAGAGQLTVRDVFVRRITPAPVDGTGVPLVEFRLSANGTPPLPWQFGQNQGQAVRVEYEPLDDGGDTAELVFLSDDPNNPELSVLMTSGELVSELRIQPNPLIFPPRNGRDPAVARVSFTNNGLKDLAINQISIEQPAQDYRLGDQQTSFQLAGGQSRTLDVTYQPQTVEGSDAILVIVTNADNVPGGQFILPLRSSAD